VSNLAVGSDFAGYRVEALVGRGGMGIIYRGTDLRLDRPVAIKLIAAERATDASVRQRFEREARLTAAIDHPNVIPIYAAGEEDGHLYLVMRYVAGTDLAALLRPDGHLAPGRAARITAQVAEALDAAHAAGLVHRDIKPANVLLAGEHTYLSDFGITRAMESGTRLTDSDQWLGTVDFCSPEQLRGERTDARSDVYALGCLLYTALTGSPPHHRETAAATMHAHLNEPPPRPSLTDGVPHAFDEVIARALAKRPAQRYPSAGDLGRAAIAAAAGRGIVGPWRSVARGPAAPNGAPSRPPRAARDPASGVRVTPVAPPSPRRPVATTQIDWRPQPGPELLPRRRRVPGRALAVGAMVAAAVAAVAIAVIALTGSGTRAPGPLSRAEVAGVVNAFAAAYGHRDAQALAAALAPDVERVSPSAVQRGLNAVLGEYRAQLADRAIESYRIANLQVQPGWAGRASALYSVGRAGQPPVSGRVVFGVERVGGRTRIGLITTQPSG
jgi:serine/threonine-protein kinase